MQLEHAVFDLGTFLPGGVIFCIAAGPPISAASAVSTLFDPSEPSAATHYSLQDLVERFSFFGKKRNTAGKMREERGQHRGILSREK